MDCRIDFDRFSRMAPGVARAERIEHQHRQRRSRFKLFDFDEIMTPDPHGRVAVVRRVRGELQTEVTFGMEPISVKDSLYETIADSVIATTQRLTKGLDRLTIGHEVSPSGDVGLRFVHWVEHKHDLRSSWLESWYLQTTEHDVFDYIADAAEQRWRQRWSGAVE